MSLRAFEIGVRADAAVRHLWLNTLWLACSLTVAGAPAATVALHVVVAEWAEGDERPVAARFFAAIRRHGVRATLTGLAFAAVAGLLIVNVFIAAQMGAEAPLVLGVLGAVAITVSLIAAAAPAAISGGAERTGGILRSAMTLVVTRPVAAVVAVLIAGAISFTALAFPPVLFLLPAPGVRIVHALRSGRRASLSLPRMRNERNYA
jgi:uncharacterized membrane protein YesL